MHPGKEARNLWDVEVLVTTEQAAGTGLLIDTKKFGYIVVREGLSLRAGGWSARSAPLPRSPSRRRSWPLQRGCEMPPERAAGRRPVFMLDPASVTTLPTRPGFQASSLCCSGSVAGSGPGSPEYGG